MTLRIRTARPDEAAAALALTRAAYARWVPVIGREPAPMTADLASAAAEGHLRLAEDDGCPLGVLVLVPHPDHLLLESVAVAPGAQGRGIGSALLAAAEDEARASGLDEIRLYTHERMAANIALYERHGYRETHRAEQDGFRRVFLTKRLPRQAKSASGAVE
ncbi:MAG: GNAT family N-acetyltransferase [Amnibacterium sp.]